MRTDFREERRWKLALAYNLAHAALEWHEAGSLAERVRLGIVVRWSPPPPEDAEMAEAEEGEQADGPFRDSQETDENGVDSRETGTPLDGYASDEESDDEPDKETVDNLAPSVALQDALEQLEQAQTGDGRPDVAEGVTLKPKVEEIEDLTALGDSAGSKDENAMDVDQTKNSATKSGNSSASTAQASDIHLGLKSTSKNPVLGVSSKEGEGSHSKGKNKVNQYAALREHIVYSEFDKLFIDWDDLDLAKGMSELSTEEPVLPSSAAQPQPHDLSSIFPDLPTYGMFDLAPLPSTEGKKKSDKKSDKDDPNRRMDEATYNKLTLTSRFMAAKPTLVGTLHPANHFKDGEWSRIEETPVFLDIDVVHPKEENLCCTHMSCHYLFVVLIIVLQHSLKAPRPSPTSRANPLPRVTYGSAIPIPKASRGPRSKTRFSSKPWNGIPPTGKSSLMPSTHHVSRSRLTSGRPGSVQSVGRRSAKRTKQLLDRLAVGTCQRRARLLPLRRHIWPQEDTNGH